MERLTVTVTEAAVILGVSRTSAYELVRAGTLPSVRLGRRIVITRRSLEDLVGGALPDDWAETPRDVPVRQSEDEALRGAPGGSRSPCSRADRGRSRSSGG
jgi:excisionase family DNA binding protein